MKTLKAQKALYEMVCDVVHTKGQVRDAVTALGTEEINKPISLGPYSNEWPLIIYAAEAGSTHIVEALLEGGADPNVIAEGANFTALGEASAYGHLDVVKALLKAGADTKNVDIEYVLETHENMVSDGAEMPNNKKILQLLQDAEKSGPRACYWVQDPIRNDDGYLTLIVVQEGESEYSLTDINWPDVGIDKAEDMVFKLNEKSFGFSREDTMGIVGSSVGQAIQNEPDM